ncbi:MAG: ACP S-malonyltransferase [Raoultibacter sp.]
MSATKSAWMFPGQGSQRPGMGADIRGIAVAHDIFTCASDIFGFDVEALCTISDAEAIGKARHAQVAVATTSIALAEALYQRGVEPSVLLGFSLGQISALAASRMLSIEATFRLLEVRARCMAEAAHETPGAMCALIGADEASATALCEACALGGVLVIANYNCPGQIVVSGSFAAVERAEDAWRKQGKRCSRLACAGAFHSPLMASAKRVFASHLATCTFEEPCTLVIGNTDAAPLTAATARQCLADHLTHPVRFEQSVALARRLGTTDFLEIGCGGVLSHLVRRIDKNLKRAAVEDVASLQAAVCAYGTMHNTDEEKLNG